MLEYYKMVLGRVSFDSVLFKKELRKAFRHLVDEEQIELKDWLRNSNLF